MLILFFMLMLLGFMLAWNQSQGSEAKPIELQVPSQFVEVRPIEDLRSDQLHRNNQRIAIIQDGLANLERIKANEARIAELQSLMVTKKDY